VRGFALFVAAVGVFAIAGASLPIGNYIAIAGALLLALVGGLLEGK
jgi:hypothetical protein